MTLNVNNTLCFRIYYIKREIQNVFKKVCFASYIWDWKGTMVRGLPRVGAARSWVVSSWGRSDFICWVLSRRQSGHWGLAVYEFTSARRDLSQDPPERWHKKGRNINIRRLQHCLLSVCVPLSCNDNILSAISRPCALKCSVMTYAKDD